MATKNWIDHNLWIIPILRIPRAKLHKQNCLKQVYMERVGMIIKFSKTTI